MPSFDTDKLTAILSAAQNPAFKKLLVEKAKAQKALDEAKTHLAELEAKLFEVIPPALKSMLQPPEPAKSKKTASNGGLKKVDLQELKHILDRRPDNILNIRKDGFDSKSIKILAEAHRDLLAYDKGTWPKVRYVK